MRVRSCAFKLEFNLFEQYSPLQPLVYWYNIQRMNNHVIQVIGNRFADLKYAGNNRERANKSIIDLILTANLSNDVSEELLHMDPSFKKFTVN